MTVSMVISVMEINLYKAFQETRPSLSFDLTFLVPKPERGMMAQQPACQSESRESV